MSKENKANELYKEKIRLEKKLKELEKKIEEFSERLEDALFEREKISENREKYAQIEEKLNVINSEINKKKKLKQEKDSSIESFYSKLSTFLGAGTTIGLLCLLMPGAYPDIGYMGLSLIGSPILGFGSSKIIISEICNNKKMKNENEYNKAVKILLGKKNTLEMEKELFDVIPEKKEINSLVEEASMVKNRLDNVNNELKELGISNNYEYLEKTSYDDYFDDFMAEFNNFKPKTK